MLMVIQSYSQSLMIVGCPLTSRVYKYSSLSVMSHQSLASTGVFVEKVLEDGSLWLCLGCRNRSSDRL